MIRRDHAAEHALPDRVRSRPCGRFDDARDGASVRPPRLSKHPVARDDRDRVGDDRAAGGLPRLGAVSPDGPLGRPCAGDGARLSRLRQFRVLRHAVGPVQRGLDALFGVDIADRDHGRSRRSRDSRRGCRAGACGVQSGRREWSSSQRSSPTLSRRRSSGSTRPGFRWASIPRRPCRRGACIPSDRKRCSRCSSSRRPSS